MWQKFVGIIQSSYDDDERRRLVMFNLLTLLLAAVSLVMTVVNIRTDQWELMGVTLAFSVVSLLNYIFNKTGWVKRAVVEAFFTVEAMVLLVYFVLSGTPQGFSVLWTLLVPSISLYVFGHKNGVRFSLLTLGMVIFFFWVPLGQGLLYYAYSETFMLRFPFVYICLFVAVLYIDTIRLGVYRRLKETEKSARRMYRHDALTGIYSRHAFYEELQKLFAVPSDDAVSILLFDIDDFKRINDAYGHNAGDEVLRQVSQLIANSTCEHCLCCRWGGEEFLVLMQCEHNAAEICEDIRQRIEKMAISFEEHTLHITVSAGVAIANTVTRANLSGFINCADKAMYASKTEGKNKMTVKLYGE